MEATVPIDWNIEEHRSYTPTHTDRELQYRTYRHESGDIRLKVAPASLETDHENEGHPGYTLTSTSYPGLELSETTTVRTVLLFERCTQIARRFMELFSARYDGPGTLEDALEYAHERTREHR